MAIPRQVENAQLSDFLEVMTKAVFQAGMRWSLIESKWENFRHAFANFDVGTVAGFTDADIERLSEDPGIIRSRKKIEGTVENARTILALDAEYRGLRNYLHSKGSYDQLSTDMKRRFKFFGELNVYYFLFRVKEPVPPFEEWVKTIEGDHPRMREMVNLKTEEAPQMVPERHRDQYRSAS
jgi:3-methyladenine DNA glycosylase Tag